jgi:hypothetical protein
MRQSWSVLGFDEQAGDAAAALLDSVKTKP